MADFTATTGTGENARKLAGRSDARQVRQVEAGNTITYDLFPFLTLYGGKAVLNDGKITDVKARIKSKSAFTMTPELYDWEVFPTEFRLTANVAGVAAGGTGIVLPIDDTTGLQVGDTLNKTDQGVQLFITSVDSQTQVTCTCQYSANGTVTLNSDASIKYLEKIGNVQPDGPSAANGTNREPINRINNLQYMINWMAQGKIQKNLRLYAGGDAPNSDYKEEIQRKLVDLNRMREGTAIAGQKATTGSGSTKRYFTGGLEYWAGSVYNNNSPDGTLSWDDFSRGLMPAIRQGGAGMEVYALCGNDVMTTFTSYSQKQTRITTPNPEAYRQKIIELDVPGGTLNLIPSEFFQKQARKGQMICFQPDYLTRFFLQNMDLAVDEDLAILGTDWVDRAAISVVEGLLASDPKTVTLVTNVLK